MRLAHATFAGAPRHNPIELGHVVVSLLFAGVGMYAAAAARARSQRPYLPSPQPAPLQATPPPELEHAPLEPPKEACLPYRYDPVAVRALIEDALESGERDPSLIATNTATRLFGQHPYGYRVTFPPEPEASTEIKCVFDKILGEVDRTYQARGLQPEDQPERAPGVVWRTVSIKPGLPDMQAYPWNFGAISRDGRPAPSTFYVVKAGDNDADLFRDFVSNALIMAGVDPTTVMDTKVGRRLKKEARNLVLCSPFNDKRVTSRRASLAGGRDPGTEGPDDAGVTFMLGPHGRGLVWRRVHYDDLARMAQGLPAKRGVDEEGQSVGAGRSRMVIYFPAVNLDRLRGPVPVLTTEGMQWSDTGRNTIHPPRVVERLGIDDSGVDLTGGPGCSPEEGPWE